MAREALIGIDLVEIDRVAKAYRRWGRRFLERVYTDAELELCGIKAPSLAGRFAVKEAVAKVLGVGIGAIAWREIETLRDPYGRPVLTLSGRALELANQLGISSWAVSIAHTRDMAVAVAIGWCAGPASGADSGGDG